MYRRTSSIVPKLRRAWRDRRGVTGLLFAVAATALIGAAGFAIDVGVALSATGTASQHKRSSARCCISMEPDGGHRIRRAERGPDLERSSSRS